MLLREQDLNSFKEGKKQHEKYLKRVAKKQEKAMLKIEARRKDSSAPATAPEDRIEIEVPSKSVSPVKKEIALPDVANGTGNYQTEASAKADKVDDDIEITDGTEFKKKSQRDKSFDSSSLWEPINEPNGKPRKWKNKLTGETKRSKTKPAEGKSAILADDVR